MANMKTLLFFLFFIISSLHAEVLFCEANLLESQEIQNSMITFYAEQLVQSGLFEDEKIAREAAIMERDQKQRDPDEYFFYYHLTAEDGKTQFGYIAYSTKDQIAYLEAIYLEKKYRGHGLGKQILQSFETLLLEKGVKLVKLYVFDHNKRAFELYNKVGYEIETTYYMDNKLIGYHMKKDL